MVEIRCNNEDCKNIGCSMDFVDEDSRQEWKNVIYSCPECGTIKTHRTEYDQNGLVILDKVV